MPSRYIVLPDVFQELNELSHEYEKTISNQVTRMFWMFFSRTIVTNPSLTDLQRRLIAAIAERTLHWKWYGEVISIEQFMNGVRQVPEGEDCLGLYVEKELIEWNDFPDVPIFSGLKIKQKHTISKALTDLVNLGEVERCVVNVSGRSSYVYAAMPLRLLMKLLSHRSGTIPESYNKWVVGEYVRVSTDFGKILAVNDDHLVIGIVHGLDTTVVNLYDVSDVYRFPVHIHHVMRRQQYKHTQWCAALELWDEEPRRVIGSYS